LLFLFKFCNESFTFVEIKIIAMTFLYWIGIKVYYLLAFGASFFSKRARLFVQGRKCLFQQLRSKIKPENRIFWFHCASLGEFEQGRSLIEEIKSRFPDVKILLTFFSPSGFEVRKDYKYADVVSYLPLDSPVNAAKFLEIVNPEKAFFIKYEYWYFFLRGLKKKSIPVYLISAIFLKNQIFFKPYGKWFRSMLYDFEHIFVQNVASKKLLAQYGITAVTVSGDTRFDRVKQIVQRAEPIELLRPFREGHFLIVAGSTWPQDEALLIRYFQQAGRHMKWIIAPHEVDKNRIDGLVKSFPADQVVRYSRINDAHASHTSVIIVDSIGLLSSLYQYAMVAYVGGGFGKGIHNILEPATFGIPVIFGPGYEKFMEAVDLKEQGGAFSIDGYGSFRQLMDDLSGNPEYMKNAGSICRHYVDRKAGATAKIFLHIFDN